MTLCLSKRSARIEQDDIRAMSIECEKIRGIDLTQGACDTLILFPIREGAHQGIDNGTNSYTRFDGLAQL